MRWEMAMTVKSCSCFSCSSTFLISSSESRSTLAVTSSSKMTLQPRSSPCASPSFCRSPPESSRPFSPILVSKPLGSWVRNLLRHTWFRMALSCSSVALGFASSRFSRMVPGKRKVSCETLAILERSETVEISRRGTLSMVMLPACGS